MNRLFVVFICAMTVVGSSFAIYKIKYEVQSVRAEIADISKEVRKEKEALHVAAAEWAYLNRPERLRKLAAKYLDARSVTVSSVAEIDAIAFHNHYIAQEEIQALEEGVRPVVLYYSDGSGLR
ncbi:MAG: hypothetical protein R3D71_08610 [Rickettsiales bacterium]